MISHVWKEINVARSATSRGDGRECNQKQRMIHLKRVSKIYPPSQPALRGIDLEITPGEFVFIAGASGAGKSTLLKLLFAGDSPSHGTVDVCGVNLANLCPRKIADVRKSIGMVFQDYKLLPRRTVLDNVAFSLEVMGVSEEARHDTAMRLLNVIGLQDRANAYPATLSGGEQQRVAVARALIRKPKVLLADEPTGNLDQEMSRLVFGLLLEANALGVTVVVATHNLAIIEDLKKRVIVLDKGRIIGDYAASRDVQREVFLG